MNYRFTELYNVAELEKLCESFSQLNGTTLAILDLDGNVLVATGWQPICVEFHRKNAQTSIRCLESDTIIASQLREGEKFTMYTCKNGLVDVAMPIMVNMEHVGNFFIGQFFLKSPDINFFRNQSKEFGFNEKVYLESLNKVPIFSQEKIKKNISLLVQLTEMLGEIGYKNYQNTENTKQLEQDKQKLNDSNKRYLKLNEEYIAQNNKLQKKEKQLELINTHLEAIVKAKTVELNEIICKLKESNITKDKFFSIISHDLRGPIGQSTQISELLENQFYDISDNEKFSLIKALSESTQRGYKLLENLLEWSKSQTGAITFNPSHVNLYEILKCNVELLQKNAKDKDIQILYNIDNQTTIWADENMINTVIRNLISNAIKFTYPKGLVEILYEKHPDCHEILIHDNGKGMTNEELKRIFKIEDSFSTPGTENEKGTGLGLIICKEFIDKHKGKILVKSKEGNGTSFIVRLPIGEK